MNILINVDMKVFYFLNHTCHNAFLDKLIPPITQYFFIFLFIAGLSFLFLRKKENRETGMALIAGLTIEYYVVDFIKEIVKRPRPFMSLADVNVLVKADNFSFPSGHTTAAFMAAYILYKRYGKGYIFYPLATLIALSRPYVGVHYPSDVLSGALIGTLIGYFLVKVTK